MNIRRFRGSNNGTIEMNTFPFMYTSLASQTYLVVVSVVVRCEWTGDEWNVLSSISWCVFLVLSPTYIVRLSTSGLRDYTYTFM